MISRLAIIGVGLIGGSLALALRKAGKVQHVVGFGRDQAHLNRAVELGVIDEAATSVAAAVKGAQVVVVATPVSMMGAIAGQLVDVLDENTVLTDVGSTKVGVVEDITAAWGRVPPNFVPGHPIAGTEKQGVEAAFAELYQDRKVILTPVAETAQTAVKLITDMWHWAGAEVTSMATQHHDEVLAATSHLPHVLAYTLVDTLGRLNDSKEIFQYAAGGFRDFTRIASSDPTMWHDICLSNQLELVKILEVFQADLQKITAAIEKGDSETIQAIFSAAKHARDNLCDHL